MFHAGEYDITISLDQKGCTVFLLFEKQGLWSLNDVKQLLATEGISTQITSMLYYENTTATAMFLQKGGFYDSEGWHDADGSHESGVFRRNQDNWHEIRGDLTIESKAYSNQRLKDNEEAKKFLRRRFALG